MKIIRDGEEIDFEQIILERKNKRLKQLLCCVFKKYWDYWSFEHGGEKDDLQVFKNDCMSRMGITQQEFNEFGKAIIEEVRNYEEEKELISSTGWKNGMHKSTI